MPTGYTYKIGEGISFKEFTLDCARAFGALISLRDEPSNTPTPNVIEPSDYALNAVKIAKAKLKRFENMKLSVAEKLCEKEYELECISVAEREKADKELFDKYQAMLIEVKKWEPPTEEHVGLKDFMIEQITSSIKGDCGHKREKPKKQNAKAWVLQQRRSAEKDIEYYTKSYAEEVFRCNERTEWIQNLMKSLN